MRMKSLLGITLVLGVLASSSSWSADVATAASASHLDLVTYHIQIKSGSGKTTKQDDAYLVTVMGVPAEFQATQTLSYIKSWSTCINLEKIDSKLKIAQGLCRKDGSGVSDAANPSPSEQGKIVYQAVPGKVSSGVWVKLVRETSASSPVQTLRLTLSNKDLQSIRTGTTPDAITQLPTMEAAMIQLPTMESKKFSEIVLDKGKPLTYHLGHGQTVVITRVTPMKL